jgi:thioredoxin reductase
MKNVSCLLGSTTERAEVRSGKVHLHLRARDGSEKQIQADHVIAATGYKIDLRRLAFLSDGIRSSIKTVKGSPILSSKFEASVPGIYFVGIAAANSFGPVMRFAYGAGFAARRLTEAMVKTYASSSSSVRVASVAASSK